MPLYLNHKGVSNASIGFWMAVLVSAGILDNGRLDVWRISLVDCWCCVFRSFVVILGSIAMLSSGDS